MLPPQIRLNGLVYNLTFTQRADDLGFKTGLGYTVDGSEKDGKLAFIWVCIGGTTLSGWIGRNNLNEDEATKKIKTIISVTLPYIDPPITLEEITEKYPEKGLTINYFSDGRDGYVENESSYYFSNSFDPEKLIERVVYGGHITQEKIENRTLHLLARYREWVFNNQQPHLNTTKGEMPYPDLLEMSFIPKSKLDLSLDVMEQEGLVEIRSVDQSIIGVRIKAVGVRKVTVSMEAKSVKTNQNKTIFYSWQNTVKPNKNYIHEALEKAIKEQPNFSIDYATRNVKGSPDINETILKKIEDCDIFLADVSIINSSSTYKKTPNPNVMYELGYAASVKGYENIILVANNNTTDPKELPFDIVTKAIAFSKFDKPSMQKFVKMLQDELAIHVPEAKTQDPLDHPYIFISGSRIQKPDGPFNVNIYNDEIDSYHLDSVELNGSDYKVDRSLDPKATTNNVNLPNVPVPPYDNRVGMIVLNVSRGSKQYKIKQNINVIDMAIDKFDIGGWEQKPNLILAT